MFTALTLENVRLFGSRREFQLKPLTVLCGTNSSGKSTVLKVLPILQQNQAHSGYGAKRLLLQAPQIDLGNYKSLVTANDTSRNIVMGLKATAVDRGPEPYGGRDERYELEAVFEFAARPVQNNPSQLIGELTSAQVNAKFAEGAPVECAITTSDDAPVVTVEFSSEYLAETQLLEHVQSIDKNSPVFLALTSGFLPHFLLVKPNGADDQKPPLPWPIPPRLGKVIFDFGELMRELRYVGPLRAAAKRFYVAQSHVSTEGDHSGESLPYLLRDKSQVLVYHNLPNESGRQVPLLQALSEWLHYLREGQSTIQSAEQGELRLTGGDQLFELKLQTSGGVSCHSLADSGFGYSQLLPILIHGLLTPPDGTLIVEQPELHLHPALQVRLADFFIFIVRSGRQVIIESHSDHLVNALRVAAAEDASHTLAELLKVYFFEALSGEPTVHDLSVQKDGTLSEWPRSFFGEALSLSGRLLRAQKPFLKALAK